MDPGLLNTYPVSGEERFLIDDCLIFSHPCDRATLPFIAELLAVAERVREARQNRAFPGIPVARAV
jgi:hypothetical protein